MRAPIAAVVCTSLLFAGCFPHNAKYRSYSKLAEGAALLTGVVMEGVINSGADCDAMAGPGTDASGCHTTAGALGTVGVVLILGGLLGFVATVSTAEDEDGDKKPVVTPGTGKTMPAAAPATTSTAGSATPAMAPKSAP